MLTKSYDVAVDGRALVECNRIWAPVTILFLPSNGFWHGSGCDRVWELAFERGTA